MLKVECRQIHACQAAEPQRFEVTDITVTHVLTSDAAEVVLERMLSYKYSNACNTQPPAVPRSIAICGFEQNGLLLITLLVNLIALNRC